MRSISRLLTAGIAVATVAGGITSHTAQAHAIWFAERAKQMALIYGVGADDLDAAKRVPLITSMTGINSEGQAVEASLRIAGPIPVVDSNEPLALVAAVMDYGTWSKDAAGKWHDKGHDEIKDATISEHNFKYAVHINQMPLKGVPLIPTQKLQLIPVGTAIPEAMGEPIKLRAYYDGKPAADVAVMQDYVNDPDQKPLKTDAQGYVTFPIRNQGQNVVVGILNVPSDNPAKYRQMEHRASLSFVLPHEPE